MDLIEKIEEDLNEAMKAKDASQVSILRLLKSALKNAEIEKKETLSDQDAIRVLEKQAKQRRDSIESYNTGGRADLAEKEAEELHVIESYLPEKLADTEIENIVDSTIKKLNVNDISGMGQVIKAVMAETQGQADGKTVSEMVKNKLS
jgi:hypothetical protein